MYHDAQEYALYSSGCVMCITCLNTNYNGLTLSFAQHRSGYRVFTTILFGRYRIKKTLLSNRLVSLVRFFNPPALLSLFFSFCFHLSIIAMNVVELIRNSVARDLMRICYYSYLPIS